ncbi:hypothetical protein ACRAWD_08430 [Caulobacter segnis]
MRMTLEAGEREPGLCRRLLRAAGEYLTAARVKPRPVYLLRKERRPAAAIAGAGSEPATHGRPARRKLFLKGPD